MIIELVGATGAGKTTLAHAARDRECGRISTIDDLVLRGPLLSRIEHPILRNIVLDIVGLPFFLLSLRRHRRFSIMAIRRLVTHAESVGAKLNYTRSVIRRVGLYERAKRSQCDAVLFDEGPVLIATLLYVYTTVGPTDDDLELFLDLVPRPDGVVYLPANESMLMRRAESRPDPRRELRDLAPPEATRAIQRTIDVFDRLMRPSAWPGTLLTLTVDDVATDEAVDALVAFANELVQSASPQRGPSERPA